MFTGIVQGTAPITSLTPKTGLTSFSIDLAHISDTSTLTLGASVSINGVCLTVTHIDGSIAHFDAIAETLRLTTLSQLKPGDLVNVERAASFGQEIGGHLLSGHISATASVTSITTPENNYIITLEHDPALSKYILHKGYIGLHGASLTIVKPDPLAHSFQVHLIPETLRQTTFASLKPGDLINVELDTQTVAIVDTAERIIAQHLKNLQP
jgi:riboflavin synthase